jgi:hypothetical protein
MQTKIALKERTSFSMSKCLGLSISSGPAHADAQVSNGND